MIARLRPLSVLCLAGLLSACAGQQTSGLGELPGKPQASAEQLLQQAQQVKPEQAALLRLSAADQALGQRNLAQAQQILDQLKLDELLPAQQIFASTLTAELALARNKPKAALQALQHPSLQRLGELPVGQQVRSQLARANALQADQQPLAAARERVFIAPLLEGQPSANNHEAIWTLVAGLPSSQLGSAAVPGDDLSGWLELSRLARGSATPAQQVASIAEWQARNPQHPAARQLPQSLVKLQEIATRPLTRIALLLPEQGQLASVGKALRDGFVAAHYQSGDSALNISLHDSSSLTDLDAFYRQAQADGVQLVVGPLEKPLVNQLSQRQQLPIPTLALNYSEGSAEAPAQLFQFGLAAEDEAREVAQRAWEDGMRRAVALVPTGEWGNRVLAAFRKDWEARGGSLIATEHVDQPVRLAQQIADLLKLRDSEARAKRLQTALGSTVEAQPARRQDVDFVFLAATPAQARQIKPTLAFQYAGDLPIYATSHLFTGSSDPSQDLDLDGIRFCETPWLLDSSDPLRNQVIGEWPSAGGSLGRLYAMGVDAYRLAPRLSQLQALPSTRLDGLSGSLSLAPGQRIVRRLPWAEYRNGQIQRLESAAR
ncbi:penicillin-binding protein activator [Pseudomonas sp. MAP12]|uniref:Penicillin-binding protein activator n=1 Tax=Geopseudomonas aromaticivorans TaxID=2849492 RepID=A0ABS6N038_9GAMM|nr:penicillin-binding protein activator [Pseudomonas aromaticivorans]MBV2134413.1 penicillin-binding protein activator [Pseudomonas aromaticivorans]